MSGWKFVDITKMPTAAKIFGAAPEVVCNLAKFGTINKGRINRPLKEV